MPVYVVTYEHPNKTGWLLHLPQHIAWLKGRLADRSLIASGPLKGGRHKAALLIISAPDKQALETLIAGDPFAKKGLIENMTVLEWEPIFGAFNTLSSKPERCRAESKARTPCLREDILP